MVYQILQTENALKVKFVSYAQRNPKYPFSLRRKPFDSLRWNGFDSSFLQEDQSQETNPKEFGAALSSPTIPISFLRIDPGIVVRHHYGIEANQQDRNPAIQRILFGDLGIEPFPGSNDFAEIPETAESTGDSSIGKASRQPARLPLESAQQTHQPDFRSGFGSDYPLRPTTRGTSWIQSQKARKTVLSSALLFRSASSGILARNSAPGKRRFGYGSCQIFEGLPFQGAARYSQKPHSLPDGFGILRTKNNPFPRRYGMRVCHRGQRISHYQSQSAEMPIPDTQQWLGNRGILRKHSSEMGQPAQVYCGPASYPGRSSRSQTTDFVQRHQACLPYFRDQPQDVGLASVSVLQSQSHYRKKQPRIPLRLSPGQNTQQLLESQCGVLPIAPVLCQYCPLVQKVVFAQRLPRGHSGYYSHGLLGSAGQTDQSRTSKHFASSQRLPLSQRIPTGFAQDSKTAPAWKFSFLQVTSQLISSWTSPKTRFSRIFEDKAQPSIYLDCDHPGLKVEANFIQPEIFWGENKNLGVLYGLFITAIVSMFVVYYLQKKVVIAVIVFLLGAFCLLPGVIALKILNKIRKFIR